MVTVVNWLVSWIITFSFNFLAQWRSEGHFLLLFIKKNYKKDVQLKSVLVFEMKLYM